MDVYSTEEEQVQAIKHWWKENIVSIIIGITIGLLVIVGYRYWSDFTKDQSQQASLIYEEILNATAADKIAKTEKLKTDFSATPYASLAVLLLVKDNVNANKLEQAAIQLKWILENGNDDAIKHITQQRLARLYLAQNNITAAEALIKGVKATGFSPAYDEIRGDINLAKKMPVQARENYRLALAAISQGDQRYSIIKMKLDDLNMQVVGVKE